MQFINVEDFETWRDEARSLLASEVAPEEVQWIEGNQQSALFADELRTPTSSRNHSVPPQFVNLAKQVSCHRDPLRWHLLYRTLFRLTHGERHLLNISTDDDVHRLYQMQKAVTRDVHKMKAFVRFRKVTSPDASAAESFIAWHRPDHRIVKLAAPFFSRRFKAMTWSILTPDESVHWDQAKLHYGPGVPASEAPQNDSLEELWKTYYASIFNPARVKVAMMKSEMPVRHWATLPEAELIPDLLRESSSRVERMIETHEGFAETATSFMPSELTLPALATAAKGCQACELCEAASQTVFGVGPSNASIMLVGEQPGDQEDIAGKPFVGPAGELLNDALQAANISRDELYLTNTVKHFKFAEREKRRLHKKPNSREIYACRPWLEAEMALVKPKVLMCLGATPAQALLGRDFRVSKSRGQQVKSDWCQQTLATWHPAAILRMPENSRRSAMFEEFVNDLRQAKALT